MSCDCPNAQILVITSAANTVLSIIVPSHPQISFILSSTVRIKINGHRLGQKNPQNWLNYHLLTKSQVNYHLLKNFWPFEKCFLKTSFFAFFHVFWLFFFSFWIFQFKFTLIISWQGISTNKTAKNLVKKHKKLTKNYKTTQKIAKKIFMASFASQIGSTTIYCRFPWDRKILKIGSLTIYFWYLLF